MSKFKLAFGIHNHQPVGNFEAVFEEAHSHAYLPFLQLVEKHPSFRMSLHQSGILWSWQEKHHPEYFKLVSKMVGRNQLEILTGGFYEPILCAIPERDVIGQIRLLSEYIKGHFGVSPNGLWLTERVWEPHLPEVLSAAGVKFLPVDDAHFIYAGLNPEVLMEPYITESNGHTVTLLPIQKKLRYLIPFGTVEELITALKQYAEKNPDGLAVYADDGEKFGVWPETYQHCYEDGWLNSFFEAIEKNSDWLEVIPLGEAALRQPAGRAYLPTASYSEMLHWAMPAEAVIEYEDFENSLKETGQFEKYGRFVRGGHWRSFLSKYEESNLMHKKMLNISSRINQLEELKSRDKNQVKDLKHNLYAGQCNCPYWHGVFGGLYLPHIRQAVFEQLLTAQNKLHQLEKKSALSFSQSDYDCDGAEEILFENNSLSAIFKPSRGGALLELSLLNEHFNLTDTLSRRREGYHHKLQNASRQIEKYQTASIHDIVKSKEENLHNLLIQDWYLKRCFIDHFFSENVSLVDFERNQFAENGDFILEPYQSSIDEKKKSIRFTREGTVWQKDNRHRITVSKKFEFEKNFVNVQYQISSNAKSTIPVLFGIENNFSFQAGHAEDRFVIVDNERPENSFPDSIGEKSVSNSFAMLDEYRQLAVALESDLEYRLWRLPIFTVSLSEAGFEKVYQGTTFVNLYQLNLSGSPVTLNLRLFAGTIKNMPSRLREKAAVSAS